MQKDPRFAEMFKNMGGSNPFGEPMPGQDNGSPSDTINGGTV